MTALQLINSGVFVHEVVPFLVQEETVPIITEEENLSYLVSLRLVCKDWNDGIVNASDFWHQFMVNNLEKAMKMRGNDEKVEIVFPIINDKNSFMVNCIRNSFLARKTIDNVTSIRHSASNQWYSYRYHQTFVTEPAILNEFNDELISEMIRLVSPFIFIENCYVCVYEPYDQSMILKLILQFPISKELTNRPN